MADDETLKLRRDGAVAILELARPAAAHALDPGLARALADAATALDADDRVRAVVLTASGPFFCAGGDLKAMVGFGDAASVGVKQLADDAHRAIATLARMDAPLIVAVNGMAAGGGFSLALVGDLVLAGESAAFVMGYTDAGLSPDGSSTYFLPRLIGLRRTQELVFTNRRLSAAEALDWGLVHRVVADDRLHTEALALAQRLAQGPRHALAAAKRLLLQSFTQGLETQLEFEGRWIARCAAGPDGQEGLQAFRQRRRAHFAP